MGAWINQNLIILTIIGAICTFAWPIIQFIFEKRDELRSREFEAYHRLIKELVSPDGSGNMWIDRQVAAVYELRHFKRYYPVSARILTHLKEKWANDTEFKWKYLIDEVDLTLEVIKRESREADPSTSLRMRE